MDDAASIMTSVCTYGQQALKDENQGLSQQDAVCLIDASECRSFSEDGKSLMCDRWQHYQSVPW